MASVHSTAEAGPQFTERIFRWAHFDGVASPEATLLVCVGSIDSENVRALSATFSGAAEQAMTLAHEVTAPGTMHPSLHIFTLSNPGFTGPLNSGIVEVTMETTATQVNAVSVVATGVDTGLGSNGVGNFTSSIDHAITAVGEVSGTVTANPGDLVLDCVVANAGLPDDHTPGDGQELVIRAPLNRKAESAAMSLSSKLAINTGEGMVRTDVTSLNTVTSTAMVVFCN